MPLYQLPNLSQQQRLLTNTLMVKRTINLLHQGMKLIESGMLKRITFQSPRMYQQMLLRSPRVCAFFDHLLL